MRVVLIAFLALALFVAAAMAKQTFPEQSQDEVKQYRWANCSTIIHGRLGDLHQYNNDSWHMVRQTPEYFFSYSPCAPKSFDDLIQVGDGGHAYGWTIDALKEQDPKLDGGSYWFILLRRDAEGEVSAYPAAYSVKDTKDTSVQLVKPTDVPDNKFVEFHMPSAKGDVPHFTSTFTLTSKTGVLPKYNIKTTFTVSCGTNTSMLDVTATPSSFDVNIESLQACARFPYTNKAMPTGGVAALVVVIIIFVIQFSICGWYRATHKMEANPADRSKYGSME